MFIADDDFPSEDERQEAYPNAIAIFVIEVISKHSNLNKSLQKFYWTWFTNGTDLGWIIDLETAEVHEKYRSEGTLTDWGVFDMEDLVLGTGSYLGSEWNFNFGALKTAIKAKFPNQYESSSDSSTSD